MAEEPTAASKSYDDIPYHGQPFRHTHPSHLASMARLLSLPAVEPRQCRVLELGCCDGGNLIPMATALPEATFVGVDYSATQIEMGRKTVGRLRVKNIDLRPVSILDITDDWGEFDYIICHGVFSWIPKPVQEKILDVCKTHLSAHGVAYISYNVNPGWHMRGTVRDMMRYHAMRFEEPARRIQEARLILDFVSQNATGMNSESYSGYLKAEAEMLKKAPDHYLYHEHLEDHCEPFYFHEFVKRAESHGLEYLAESRLGAMAPTNFGPTAERALAAIATNLIELEQFMDFLRNRTFRETLLHRPGERAIYAIEPKRLGGLYIACPGRPKSKVVNLEPEKTEIFESLSKYPVESASPLVKAALLCLVNEFPGSIQFEDLVRRARKQLAKVKGDTGKTDKDAHRLGSALLKLLTTTDMIEVWATPPAFVTKAGKKPLASALARLQAEEGRLVTTRRHNTATLREDELKMLKLLDGTRSTEKIAAELKLSEQEVGDAIRRLGRCALIVE